MSTTAQIVTRALRRLQAIDINEQPSNAEMSHAVDIMEEVLNGWAALGVYTPTFTLLGDTTSGDLRVQNVLVASTVSGVNSTANVMIGQNVSGTGVASGARVGSVITDTLFTLDTPATASGGATTLTFTFLPMPASLEGALVALLAVRLSEDLGLAVSAKLQMDASDGWNSILSACIPDRKSVFDRAIAAPAGVWDPTTDLVR